MLILPASLEPVIKRASYLVEFQNKEGTTTSRW